MAEGFNDSNGINRRGVITRGFYIRRCVPGEEFGWKTLMKVVCIRVQVCSQLNGWGNLTACMFGEGGECGGVSVQSIYGDNIQLAHKAAGDKCNINVCNWSALMCDLTWWFSDNVMWRRNPRGESGETAKEREGLCVAGPDQPFCSAWSK